MKTYTVHEAKSQLSRLIKMALEGKEIVICNRKNPVIKLLAIRQPKRKLGVLGTKGVWMRNDFNVPLKDFQGYQ